MKEIKNFNEITELFPWKPTFNKVIITLNTEEVDNNLVLSDNTMAEKQTVIAVGRHVNEVVPGDTVLIDMEKMLVKEINPNDNHEMITRVKIDPIEYEGVMYALVEDRLIKAVWK